MGEASELDDLCGAGFDSDELEDLVARYERSSGSAPPAWLRAYSPLESQRRFHDSLNPYKGFSGPVGSGKSKALVAEAIRLAYANPGRTGLIGAPTYKLLADVTRTAFEEVLLEARIPYKLNRSTQINAAYLTEPRARILFRSLEVPERLVGANLAWVGVDELTYCKEDSWKRLEARVRDPKAKERTMFASWTPKGFDWVYDRFINPAKRIAGHDAIQASPRENIHLPTDYYDKLKASYDPRFYEQEVLGLYVNIYAGRVYHAFDREENVAPVTYDPRVPLFWALDFNISYMCSVIGQIIGDRVHVLEEIVLRDANTWLATRAFDERMAKYRTEHRSRLPIRIYGDASGSSRQSSADRTDYQSIKLFFQQAADRYEAEFRIMNANPTHKARAAAVNGLLCNSAGVRRLIVAPECKELITDLERVSWREGVAEIDKREEDRGRVHTSDSLGYLATKEFSIEAFQRVITGRR